MALSTKGKLDQVSMSKLIIMSIFICGLFLSAGIKQLQDTRILKRIGIEADIKIQEKYSSPSRGGGKYYVILPTQDPSHRLTVKLPFYEWVKMEVGQKYTFVYNPEDIRNSIELKSDMSEQRYVNLIIFSLYLSVLLAFTIWFNFTSYKVHKHNLLKCAFVRFLFFCTFEFVIGAAAFIVLKNAFAQEGISMTHPNIEIMFWVGGLSIFFVGIIQSVIIIVREGKKLKQKLFLQNMGGQAVAKVIELEIVKRIKVNFKYEFLVKDMKITGEIKNMIFPFKDGIEVGEETLVFYDPENPNNNVWAYQ